MPDSPPVHHTFNCVEEAESWAQSIGVTADYDARLDLANLANELLWQLTQRALPLPDAIRVDKQVFRPLGIHRIQTPASTNEGRISINPDALYWIDPKRIAYELRQNGFWSSGSPMHPLYHEAGHALIYKADPESWLHLRDLTNAQKTIAAGEVSRRSCQDGYEFVAEVFAGLTVGRKFSKDVVRWYRSRGGIKVW